MGRYDDQVNERKGVYTLFLKEELCQEHIDFDFPLPKEIENKGINQDEWQELLVAFDKAYGEIYSCNLCCRVSSMLMNIFFFSKNVDEVYFQYGRKKFQPCLMFPS